MSLDAKGKDYYRATATYTPRKPPARLGLAPVFHTGHDRRGGLEATGTGTKRISGLDLSYPIFNWDEIPAKQGLHNSHLVGLMAANTFLNVTGLSLYGETVLVGYGPVDEASPTRRGPSAPSWRSST